MKRILLLVPIAALCIWALVIWVYHPISCNQKVNEMRARTTIARETADTYRMTVLARDNLTALRRLEGPCRMTITLYLLEADNEDLLGRKETAIERLRHALTIDQRPEIYFAIGTLFVELGRMDEAVENYVHASRIKPLDGLFIPSPEAERRVRERLEQMRARRQK